MACSSVIAHELERIVPAAAYSEIQPRQGDTATFLLHQDFVNKVLKASGQNSIFYKDKSTNKEFELLWLEAESSLTDARKLAEHDDVFGIATKAKSGDTRFALRFQDIEAMKSFAKAHHLPDQSDKGRFKLTGENPTIGLHGVATFLLERQWADIEVLYIADGTAIFVTSEAGDTSPAYYLLHGVKRQLMFKALNARAREMVKSSNIRIAGEKHTPSKTGETPDGKRRADGQ